MLVVLLKRRAKFVWLTPGKENIFEMAIKKKLIFIVDDDELVAQMLSDHITRNNLRTVKVFKTGEECLANLDMNPDAVILDYHLDSVVDDAANGLVILQKIKKMDRGIQVIMLSSQDEYGKALQTIISGAFEYVIKNNDAFDRLDALLED